jgi:hypothetical protein
MMLRTAINLAAKLATFDDHWQPRVVGGVEARSVSVASMTKGRFA